MKVSTKKVSRIVEVDEKVVVLELSEDEVQFLTDFIGYGVNGTGRKREIFQQIYDALTKAGYPASDSCPDDMEGMVTFHEQF